MWRTKIRAMRDWVEAKGAVQLQAQGEAAGCGRSYKPACLAVRPGEGGQIGHLVRALALEMIEAPEKGRFGVLEVIREAGGGGR